MTRSKDFETIAMPYLDAVYRAAVALCGCEDDAEDLVQRTYAKALERFGSFAPGSNCRAWLLRILRNLWIDELRHRRVVGPVVPVEEVDPPQAPAGPAETAWSDARDVLDNFSDDQVRRALDELPDDQRLSLFLVDVEGLSHEEVAAITGVPVGTIKSRTSRARAVLKEKLQAHARDLGFTGRRR